MIIKSIAKSLLAGILLLTLWGPLFSQGTLRVMPLGNSITKGYMCTNGWVGTCALNNDDEAIGYRKVLRDMLEDADYDVDFVGSESNGSSLMVDTDHSGYAGAFDEEVAEIMETGYSANFGQVSPGPLMESHLPQLVLLHIGTNDANGTSVDPSEVTNILDAIDDFESTYSMPVLVFVSRIISQRGYDCGNHPYVTQYNNALYTLVQNRISAGDDLVWVDMECGAGLDYSNEMMDELHPKQAGYDKMGSYWFQAIDTYNAAPVCTTVPEQITGPGKPFSKLVLDNIVSDAENADADLIWTVSPSPVYYNVSIDANREATITPKNSEWNGTEEITFVVTDQGKVIPHLKKSTSLSIVYTLDWSPEITGQQDLSTPEDTPLELGVSDLIYADPQNAPDDLSIIIDDGDHYTVEGNTITPESEYSGMLSIPVQLSGGGEVSETYMLSVEVLEVNDVPVITGQTGAITMVQNSCQDILPSDLVVEDPDATYPDDFTVLIQAGANYTFSGDKLCPTPTFSGELAVTVKVSDGSAESNAYSISVDVLPIKPEFILPETLTVDQDQEYSGTLIIKHYDPSSFTYTKKEVPSWLNFDEESGLLSGNPGNDDVGDYELEFEIFNGLYREDTIFTLSVNNLNDLPVFITQSLEVAQTMVDYSFQLEVVDIDPDDKVLYDLVEKPGWLNINSTTGNLSGTPERADEGISSVRIRVFDGHAFGEMTYPLVVEFYNHPPQFTSYPNDTAYIGNTYLYGVEVNDMEGDPVSYFAKKIPAWGEFISNSQVLIGTPDIEHFGNEVTILGISDGMDTTYQEFTIYVRNPVGVRDPFASELRNVKVYPNPFSTNIFVEIDLETFSTDQWHFILTDMAGRQVYNTLLPGHNEALTIPDHLLPGIYFYQIRSSANPRKHSSGKIIKQ